MVSTVPVASSDPGSPRAGLRIAYLTEWTPYEETGVLRKLIGQIEAWRGLGAEAQLFSVAPLQDRTPALEFERFGTVVGAIHQRFLDKYPFARLGYVNKVVSLSRLKKALRAFRPDVIYYRQNGPWYPGLDEVFSIAPTVLELNTDETVENKLWGSLFSRFHRATQARTHDRMSGFVCVTGEIARKFRAAGKPVAVIGNSMWGEPQPLPPASNSQPVFVFVGSATIGELSWHGVDKIFRLASRLPQSTFHVVGMTADAFPGSAIPDNVVMHGEKRGAALIDIYRQSDIGIGSLALHRIDLEEACPLKTREYLMYGLPVVIGYTEVEERLNDADFVIRLKNQEDNVAEAVDRIGQFSERWKGRRISADLRFLTSEAMARQRLEFFASIIKPSNPST